MKKLLLATVIVASVCIIGCKNGGGGENPSTVLSEFFDAMIKNDKVKIKDLTTAESASMLSMMEMGMEKGGKDMNKFDNNKMEIGTAVIDGDKAKVPVKEKGKSETVNFLMKKEGGKWKVAFDKASIMEMATDKMKGTNIGDSLTSAMGKLKSANIDSIKDEVNKAMKDVDLDELKNKVKNSLEESKQK